MVNAEVKAEGGMLKGDGTAKPAPVNIRQKGSRPASAAGVEWASLRLRDRIRPGVRVLFVGINPGVRSALTGHHFAGPSNRFWKLLYESRLVDERIGYRDDDRLAEWGYGITNLVPRASPGIDDLRPAEYVEGWRALERKLRTYTPAVVALVGVTLYRAILPLVDEDHVAARSAGRPVRLGAQSLTIHGARVFVLPNPSGRNANFTYAEMLAAFKGLRRHLNRMEDACRS
jgi:TDG/mug DNA glycosylase family protein